jgi:hypothetical protein
VFNGNSFLYPNTYLVTLTASRAMELLPASASDLVAYFTGQGGEPDAELVAAPPSASGTACPFREKDQLVSKLSLDPGQSCSYYVRVYQHPSSVNANYLIRFSSRSNGIVGQQTAPIVSDSAPGMTFTCSGKKYFPSVITMNQILVKTAGFYAYPAMSLLGSGNGTYTIPTSGLIAIDRVFIKYQNGSNCAASTGSFCGVSVNPVAGGGLLIPSATSGSPPVYAWVVAKETIPSTTTAIKFYKQELFFGEASLEIAEEVSPSHNGLDISMKVKH